MHGGGNCSLWPRPGPNVVRCGATSRGTGDQRLGNQSCRHNLCVQTSETAPPRSNAQSILHGSREGSTKLTLMEVEIMDILLHTQTEIHGVEGMPFVVIGG